MDWYFVILHENKSNLNIYVRLDSNLLNFINMNPILLNLFKFKINGNCFPNNCKIRSKYLENQTKLGQIW